MQNFWQSVAESAAQVITCAKCKEQQQNRNSDGIDLGLTQPGWVGPEYQSGKGVVFVLQNPGVGGIKRTGNEPKHQAALQALADNPTADQYSEFVEMVLLMVPDWPMWKRHVSGVAEGCLPMANIAWLNTVKFRTPCDGTPTVEEKEHGCKKHLLPEITLLKPAMIVTIGNPAYEAITDIERQVEFSFAHQHLKMRGAGSGRADGRKITSVIRGLGLCQS